MSGAPVCLQEVEVITEVEPFRCLRALGAEAQAVVEVVVDVRAGQVDQPLFGAIP